MRVIDRVALTGSISVNCAGVGDGADEYYCVCSIVMELEEGNMEADLEAEHLPGGGHRIAA